MCISTRSYVGEKKWLISVAFIVSNICGNASYADIVSKQKSYKVDKEDVKRLIVLSTDNYDAFYQVKITKEVGIKVSVPVDGDSNGLYEMVDGWRRLPILFSCDYTQGETVGTFRLRKRSARNVYTTDTFDLTVKCVPLSESDRALQIANEHEVLRREAERQEAAVKEAAALEEKRLDRERDEAEAALLEEQEAVRQRVIESTPAYKRKVAQQAIRRLSEQALAARRAIAEERRIGQVSGFVNATRLNKLGGIVIYLEDEIQNQWGIYKANGGDAKTVKELK